MLPLLSVSNNKKIVSAVIGSLTPSIEEAVMSALMANMATTQTQQTQSTFSSTSTQSDAGFSSTSVSSSSSSISEQVLITRIIEALTPSITAAVRKALQGRYESQQAALLLQQQQQEALLLQQQQQEALLIQQQQDQVFQSQVSNTASQQSSSSSSNLSSGTLTNIFGESGSAHNVKVETPEFNYEYNTRK